MKIWGRLSGKQHYWSFNSEMEVIISLKTLKVSENSWVFSSALLWSMYISSPSVNIFSSWIATLANLVGRDPIHSSFVRCWFTAYLMTTASHLFQDMHLGTEGSTTEMLYLTQFEVTVLFEPFSLLADEWALILTLVSLHSPDHLWHFQGLKLLLWV